MWAEVSDLKPSREAMLFLLCPLGRCVGSGSEGSRQSCIARVADGDPFFGLYPYHAVFSGRAVLLDPGEAAVH